MIGGSGCEDENGFIPGGGVDSRALDRVGKLSGEARPGPGRLARRDRRTT